MTTATANKWVRVTKHNLCPICGKPDWCLISEDGKSAICARTESDKPAGNKGAGWIHTLDNSMPLPPLNLKPDAKQTPKAAPDILGKAYGALLTALQLSKRERVNLQRRGFTDDDILRLSYKTLPMNGRRAIIQRLTAKGIKLIGVPGFWLELGKTRLSGPAGILIPVRDTKSRIVGLQIRCHSTDNGSRYRWLSSRNYFAGCSPGAPVHVARPVSTSREVWITEGPLKADIAALKLGRSVLAVAGVGNWPGVIPIIRELAPSRVIIAFDMDKLSNPVVNLHKDALITCLIRRGIRTFEADWDTHFKGLDDLLTGGQSCQR